MNRPFLIHPWLVVIFALLAGGCNLFSKDKNKAKKSAVLSAAPYAGLTDSIKRFPNEPALYLQRAVLLSQNNLHEVATDDYKKAWKMTGDENVALEYASNLLLIDDIDEAVDLLQEGSEKFPDNTEFSRRLGEIYIQTGEASKALEQYESILHRDSSNFEAWYDKGMLLAQMKDTTAAINALEHSFSIMPISYSGLALANMYVYTKDARALEVCDILLERDSSAQQTDAMFIKGIYYSDTKQYDKALEQFEECIKRDWKMTDAHIEKGIVQFEMGAFNKALETFTMAATVSNTNADAYFWMARCYEATGKREEAITNYERAITLDNSFVEARQRLRRLNNS